MRVVIADDSVLLREGIAKLLEESGFEVAGQSSTADDLMLKVRSYKPDVAIVDIRMPPTHTDEGLRAAKEIRESYPDVGVLVLSQYVEAGYAMVNFHAGTSLARLYSFAVDEIYRGQGVATRLLSAAEQAARSHECLYLRLEVRRDNTPAIELYKRNGYREFGVYTDYYEDHMEALRLEKRLGNVGPSAPLGARLVP